ncbi:MAG: membrane protein insertion efficiency factor YidD [Bacteroides sp.]|nr:membrane protein insertion efficiency factor YidD [Bacteroides sp.]
MNKNIRWCFWLFVALLLTSQGSFGQAALSDLELLEASVATVVGHDDHQHVDLLETRSGSWLARYNPFSLTFTGLMFVYQRYVSPQLPSECLYETSCSHFSKNLIREYGLMRGVFFTADRLTRCNRVAALDVHPLVIGEQSGKIRESVQIYRLEE